MFNFLLLLAVSEGGILLDHSQVSVLFLLLLEVFDVLLQSQLALYCEREPAHVGRKGLFLCFLESLGWTLAPVLPELIDNCAETLRELFVVDLIADFELASHLCHCNHVVWLMPGRAYQIKPDGALIFLL